MGPPGGLIPRPPIYPGQKCLAERSMDPSTEELGFAGEPSRGQEGVGSGSPQRAARTALRQRAMERTERPDSGPKIHRTPAGPVP